MDSIHAWGGTAPAESRSLTGAGERWEDTRVTDPWVEWRGRYRQRGVERLVLDGGGPAYGSAETARRKVLFVLKEPHGTQWEDARQQLSARPVKMWHALARWAYGILKGFPDYSTIGLAEEQRALQRIAVLNLKKEGGGRTSVPEVINAFAHRDADILRDQIGTLAPNIIVACGADVFGPLVWILNVPIEDPAAPLTSLGRVPNEPHRWLVPWRHPTHGAGVANYKKLQRLVSPILHESD